MNKCLGCEKEAHTKKGWCSLECYRKNQLLISNLGRFKKDHNLTQDIKYKIGKKSKEWHQKNPQKTKEILNLLNTPAINLKKSLKKENHPQWIDKISYQCPQCYITIMILPNQIKNNKKVFCSKKCYLNYHSSGKHKGKILTPRVNKICLLCGKEYQVKITQENRSKFCSFRCHGIYRVKNSHKKETDIEKALEKILEELNIKYDKQKIINNRTICDFFIYPNICIYADGDYWHNRDEVKKRDLDINIYLKEMGYIILRFYGKDILSSSNKIKEKICLQLQFLNNNPQPLL